MITKMMGCLCWFSRSLLPIWLGSFLLLAMRLWMANIFFYSGLSKLDAWEGALNLFQYEYKVPLVSYQFAAYSATFFEVIGSLLLVLGLMTRLISIPLFVMVLVIQFTYLDLKEHFYWMFLFGTLLCFGGGRFSVDALIAKSYHRKCEG